MGVTGGKFISSVLVILVTISVLRPSKGDLESTFARCCALGANWARERQKCLGFPTPVPGEPPEHQSICITAASICCLRFYRETQCENAKQAAKFGLECTTSSEPGGEFYKDCCDGCKLGLVSGSMAMGCTFRGFSFGFPWHSAYLECCLYSSPPGAVEESTSTQSFAEKSVDNHAGSSIVDLDADDENFLFINRPDAKDVKIPDSDNLCLLFPGQLCGHVCMPTPGSYVCQCRSGFTLSLDGKTCIQDLSRDSRCEINNPCDHICRDTGVSIECSCNPGYQLGSDERTCKDIDECTLGTHLCIPGNQVCFNREGSYSCINADGSLSNPALPWASKHKIRQDVPSFRIGSPSPLMGSGNARSPSTARLGVQGYAGIAGEGDFSSQGICPPGYKFNLQSRVCDDVDECAVVVGICGHGAACQNTIGSFGCIPLIMGDCPSGFKFDMNHQSCLDVDECVQGSHSCGSSDFCINTRGSYECHKVESAAECPAGYKYNTEIEICEDVDECLEGLHSCHMENETCRNIIGAYECDLRCDDGFQFTTEPPSCVDINECATGFHSCNPLTELCFNTEGSYQCRSLLGNELQHIHVSSLPLSRVAQSTPVVQECPQGYGFELNANQCLDINECASELHNCTRSTHQCINTLGGFICIIKRKCSSGYKTNPKTQECADIDECSAGLANCLPGQICVNTDGSFECQVECRDGFVYEPQDPAICVDINECLNDPCKKDEQCTNTEGSYVCLQLIATSSEQPLETSLSTIPETTAKRRRPSKAACPPGYRRKRRNSECKDINECDEGSDSCLRAMEECVNVPGSFMCRPKPCKRGFFRNANLTDCQDIDECSNFPCRFDEDCINTPGSFLCRVRPPCEAGYRRQKETNECEDIDECEEEAPCDVTTRCINTKGSYRCRSLDCSPGYQRNPRTEACEDVDECETGEHTCREPGETCVNSPGTYRCKPLPPCPQGFIRDPVTFRCGDVDECVEGLDDCLEGEMCVNQYGRYKCKPARASCSPGYRYEESSSRCEDINECEEETDNCRSEDTCINSDGSFRCVVRHPVCEFGYQLNEDLLSCIDIDECMEGSHLCSVSREKCVNLPGGYRCDRIETLTTPRPETTTTSTTTAVSTTTKTTTTKSGPSTSVHPLPLCPDGYTYNVLFRSCIDINECEQNPCGENEICINILGGHKCNCKDGFTRDETLPECRDMNECQLGLHTCEALQRCDNTIGSYTCVRLSGCGTGYTLNHNTGFCEDVNECIDGDSPCKRNEVCFNLVGTYECRSKINCGRGYRMNELGTQCVDIDECAEGQHTCDGGQSCTNRPGGYVCQCPPGYRLDRNRQCQDINECQTAYASLCGTTGECENLPGSYRCNCRPGFKKSSDDVKSCTDIDECSEIEGICHHNCINIWGSHYCTCNAGFKLERDNRTCSDINECEEIRGRGRLCLGICVNTPGTFKCECPDGYRLDSDLRTCKDVNECDEVGVCREPEEICVNTRGGHRCQKITCPPNYVRDATHRNMSASGGVYCRKSCSSDDRECHFNSTQAVIYHFVVLPSMSELSHPMPLTSLQIVSSGTWKSSYRVNFEIKSGNDRNCFDIERSSRSGWLRLIQPVIGPDRFVLRLYLDVIDQYRTRSLRSRTVAFVDIDVAAPIF